MTFVAALILLCLAVLLVASAGIQIARADRDKNPAPRDAEGTGQVESELLRRPLRSRYDA